MNMEMPDKFVGGEEINIESAKNLIDRLGAKTLAGESLTDDDKEEILEKISSLREVQSEVDGPEIRNAITRLVAILNTAE